MEITSFFRWIKRINYRETESYDPEGNCFDYRMCLYSWGFICSRYLENWYKVPSPIKTLYSVYLVLWQSGFTENLLTRYDSNLSGFMAIWFYRKPPYQIWFYLFLFRQSGFQPWLVVGWNDVNSWKLIYLLRGFTENSLDPNGTLILVLRQSGFTENLFTESIQIWPQFWF